MTSLLRTLLVFLTCSPLLATWGYVPAAPRRSPAPLRFDRNVVTLARRQAADEVHAPSSAADRARHRESGGRGFGTGAYATTARKERGLPSNRQQAGGVMDLVKKGSFSSSSSSSPSPRNDDATPLAAAAADTGAAHASPPAAAGGSSLELDLPATWDARDLSACLSGADAECDLALASLELETRGLGARTAALARQNWPQLTIISCAAIYGTNFACVKLLDDAMPASQAAALRFGLAAAAMLPFTATASGAGALGAGFEVGAWNALGYTAQAIGLAAAGASAGKSAFLCSLAVVVVPLLDASLGGKRLEPRACLSAALALIGVALLELGGAPGAAGDAAVVADAAATAVALGDGGGVGGVGGLVASLPAFELAPGDGWSLIQPLFFGIGFWRMEDTMRRYPDDALPVAGAQLVAVAAAAFLWAIGDLAAAEHAARALPAVLGGALRLDEPWTAEAGGGELGVSRLVLYAGLAWTGLVTTALTVLLETLALSRISAAEATVLFTAEPLFGAWCASALLGETLGPLGAVGASFIIAGCVYSSVVGGGETGVEEGEAADAAPAVPAPLSYDALIERDAAVAAAARALDAPLAPPAIALAIASAMSSDATSAAAAAEGAGDVFGEGANGQRDRRAAPADDVTAAAAADPSTAAGAAAIVTATTTGGGSGALSGSAGGFDPSVVDGERLQDLADLGLSAASALSEQAAAAGSAALESLL